MRAAAGMSAVSWNQAVLGQTPPLVHPLVQELAVAPLPTKLDPATGMPSEAYVAEQMQEADPDAESASQSSFGSFKG